MITKNDNINDNIKNDITEMITLKTWRKKIVNKNDNIKNENIKNIVVVNRMTEKNDNIRAE